MEEQQLLRNPDVAPTREVLSEALGLAGAAYVKFVDGLKARDIQVEWRYYNDGKAWLGKGLFRWTGARGGQKEVTACWLSVWDGFFKVTIYVPENARLNALSLPLHDATKKTIENAKQIGKLKFFPLIFDVRSDEWLDDIHTLVHFRKTI